jgi:hypothetical protein
MCRPPSTCDRARTYHEGRTPGLGGIYTDHGDLYGRMLSAAVAKLPSLGRERYRNCKIQLARL